MPPSPIRRALLLASLLGPAGARALSPRPLVFPRDHGAHPELRTEWWYLTGHAEASDGPERGRRFGFQITFFRTRVDEAQALRSRLAARQLLFAHAAIGDLQGGRLWHAERIARWNGEPGGLNDARLHDTDVRLGGWQLRRQDSGYQARARDAELLMALEARPTQPLLLQGAQGLSRKGPEAHQASFYYSQPQLAVSGELGLGQRRWTVAGRAWLDHEWSETLLHPEAVGWDWIGMNLHGGGSLTAFQLRRADGSALWAGGSWRPAADAPARIFAPHELRWQALRHWHSPRTGARYPVAWRLSSPAGEHEALALFDAQELDTRASTGNVYWEGLSELRAGSGPAVGLGYLEMTGYASRLRV